MNMTKHENTEVCSSLFFFYINLLEAHVWRRDRFPIKKIQYKTLSKKKKKIRKSIYINIHSQKINESLITFFLLLKYRNLLEKRHQRKRIADSKWKCKCKVH